MSSALFESIGLGSLDIAYIFIGMFVIDPVHAVFTAFDLDEGEPMDPDDIARM